MIPDTAPIFLRQQPDESGMQLPHPGDYGYAMNSAPKTYLRSSLIGAILFFLPLGVVAVFYALTARGRLENGDEIGAARAALWARRFMVLTFVFGGAIYLVLVIAFLALGAFSS